MSSTTCYYRQKVRGKLYLFRIRGSFVLETLLRLNFFIMSIEHFTNNEHSTLSRICNLLWDDKVSRSGFQSKSVIQDHSDHGASKEGKSS